MLEQHREALGDAEQTPELLERMMVKGTEMLLGVMPRVLAGELGQGDATPQDESQVRRATQHAPHEGSVRRGRGP